MKKGRFLLTVALFLGGLFFLVAKTMNPIHPTLQTTSWVMNM